jgi:hypothetical protein
MALGTHMTALNYHTMLTEFQIHDPIRLMIANIHILLDGFGWRPFRDDFDYEASYQRIRSEVFSHEFHSLPTDVSS